MNRLSLPYSPWICLAQWLGLLLAITVIVVVVGVVVPNDGSIAYLKWMQLIQSAGILIIPSLWVAYKWTKQPLKWLHLTTVNRSYSKPLVVLACFLWIIVSMPSINILNYWNQHMVLPDCLAGLEAWMKQAEEMTNALVERFMHADTIGVLLINIGLMAIVPAIGEELTFRGVLLNLFSSISSRKNPTRFPHIAIWIIAIIFSAIHLQFYGFIPRMLLGAVLGYIAVWTGSLWMPILVHFTNNLLTILLYYIAQQYHIDQEVLDSIGMGKTLWLGLISIVLSIGILLWIFRLCQTGSTSNSTCTPLQDE